jgi:hypothetical protein
MNSATTFRSLRVATSRVAKNATTAKSHPQPGADINRKAAIAQRAQVDQRPLAIATSASRTIMNVPTRMMAVHTVAEIRILRGQPQASPKSSQSPN